MLKFNTLKTLLEDFLCVLYIINTKLDNIETLNT